MKQFNAQDTWWRGNPRSSLRRFWRRWCPASRLPGWDCDRELQSLRQGVRVSAWLFCVYRRPAACYFVQQVTSRGTCCENWTINVAADAFTEKIGILRLFVVVFFIFPPFLFSFLSFIMIKLLLLRRCRLHYLPCFLHFFLSFLLS